MAEFISAVAGALQATLGGMLSRSQVVLDRGFPPERREEVVDKVLKFVDERPVLASFIFSELALTAFPLSIFILTSISVVLFSLLSALLVGLLGALTFISIVVGFALLILLPVLFVTTSAAAFIWLWGLGAYYVFKWFNKNESPGVYPALAEPNGNRVEDRPSKAITEGDAEREREREREREPAIEREKAVEVVYVNGDAKHTSPSPSTKAPSRSSRTTTEKDHHAATYRDKYADEDKDKKRDRVAVPAAASRAPPGYN